MLINCGSKQYQLRDMALADLPEIMAIETRAHNFPWNLTHFESSIVSSHQARVLICDDNIVGYIITSTVMDEAELLNITVSPSFQRQGVGTLLIDTISQLFSESVNTLFLEVRSSNTPAIGLYQSLGFNEIGLRPNYYPAISGREDAIIMAKTLIL